MLSLQNKDRKFSPGFDFLPNMIVGSALNKSNCLPLTPTIASVNPVDNSGTVVGENMTPYGILALWTVNGLSIVYSEATSVLDHTESHILPSCV